MIENYEAAREAVDAAKRPTWEPPGTFWVDETGFENARFYLVPWGAREWLVGGDETFMRISGTWTLVNRITEEVTDVVAADNLHLLTEMTPTDENDGDDGAA